MKNVKAITLISLIITIVILIILAGIGINLSLGSNGIFNRAKEAKEETNKQTAIEKINLKITTAQMNKYAEKQVMPTLKELSEVLRDDNEIQYVTEKSQIASTKYEVGENPNTIFTKLKDYNYEFEINSSLELVSINRVKIADQSNNEELEKVKNEFDNYKKVIAESLTKNGVNTSKEDSIETITKNMDKLFIAGVNSKFIKVAEDVSSRYVQNINVSNMANYKKFNIDNFVIVNKSMVWQDGSDNEAVTNMSKTYDQENGILQLGKQKSYTNTSYSVWTFWNLYDVYVFDEQ